MRFAPRFAAYFKAQNERIDSGKIEGIKITVTSMAMSNGKHDPLTQMESYIPFVKDASGYGPLQNDSVLSKMTDALDKKCIPALEKCYEEGSSKASDEICNEALKDCVCVIGPSPAIRH